MGALGRALTAMMAEPNPSRRRLYLVILALSGFVTSFGAHVVAVNLPDYAEKVGFGALMIGLLIAVYDFAELFAKPAAGRRGMRVTLLAGLVVALAAVGCEGKQPRPAAITPVEFRCLKVSQGPGGGRECAGPGYVVGDATAEDTFTTKEAWCITHRVSWTDPHSRMKCVPTEKECQQDLRFTRAGKQNLFLRTDCTRTAPEAWTPKVAEYPKPDGFDCRTEPDFHSKEKGAVIHKCMATPAEMLDDTGHIEAKAWCFEGPDKGKMFNMHCYLKQVECVTETMERHNAEDSCSLLGPETVIHERARLARAPATTTTRNRLAPHESRIDHEDASAIDTGPHANAC